MLTSRYRLRTCLLLLTLLFIGPAKAQIRSLSSGGTGPLVGPATEGKPLVVTFFAFWSEESLQRLRQMEGIAAIEGRRATFIAVCATSDNWPAKKIRREYTGTLDLYLDMGAGSGLGVSGGSVGVVFVLDKDGNKYLTKYSGGDAPDAEVSAAIDKFYAKELARQDRAAQRTSPADGSSDAASRICPDLQGIAATLATGSTEVLATRKLSVWGTAKTDAGRVYYLLRDAVPVNSAEATGIISDWQKKITECLPAFRVVEEQAGGFADLLSEKQPMDPTYRYNGAELIIRQWPGGLSNLVNIVLEVKAAPVADDGP